MSLAESHPNPAERRALPRQPTTLKGKVFPGGHDCTIRDYNKRGAASYLHHLNNRSPLIQLDRCVLRQFNDGPTSIRIDLLELPQRGLRKRYRYRLAWLGVFARPSAWTPFLRVEFMSRTSGFHKLSNVKEP